MTIFAAAVTFCHYVDFLQAGTGPPAERPIPAVPDQVLGYAAGVEEESAVDVMIRTAVGRTYDRAVAVKQFNEGLIPGMTPAGVPLRAPVCLTTTNTYIEILCYFCRIIHIISLIFYCR